MEQSCERAIEVGLPAIAFTEHADWALVHEGQHSVDMAGYFDSTWLRLPFGASELADAPLGASRNAGRPPNDRKRSPLAAQNPIRDARARV